MKRKRLIFPVLLAAVLTACTVPQKTATVPTASPAPSSTPAPTETPAPTQPPSAQLTYEMLPPVERERAPYTHDSSFMPVDEDARRNGLTLVEALRANDEELLRTTLSDSLLESGLPLPDLTGLVITDVFMGGGKYEVPFAELAIVDAGASGLSEGWREFRFSFDEEGKVSEFSVRGEDLREETAQEMGLEPGAWVCMGTLDATDEWQEQVRLYTATMVVGRKLDALGFSVGEVRAFSVSERYSYGEDDQLASYEMLSCEELPGDWPIGTDRYDRYAVLPEGNCLDDEELREVCEALNVLFAQLLDGTYTREWTEDAADAAWTCWDAARPVPVEVTPGVLRSDVLQFPNPDIQPKTQVWVPLPDDCWAVCTVEREDGAIQLSGFGFMLAAP